MKLFRSREDRRGAVLRALAGLGVGVTLYLVLPVPEFLTSPEAMRDYVQRFGVLSAAVFVGLQAAQTVIAPIPGQATGVAAGYLFGTWTGTLYSVVGIGIGSYIAVALSRHLGRPYVERTVRPQVLEKFDGFMTDRGEKALFLVFLVPGLPDDALCFVAGLSDTSIPRLTTLIIMARTPAYFLTAAAGNSLALDNLASFTGLVAVVGTVSAISLWKMDEILDLVNAHF